MLLVYSVNYVFMFKCTLLRQTLLFYRQNLSYMVPVKSLQDRTHKHTMWGLVTAAVWNVSIWSTEHHELFSRHVH